jgi:hypothetical protein
MPAHSAIVAIVSVTLTFAGVEARADSIALNNGGEIRGELLTNPKAAGHGSTVSIRTLSGASVSVVREEIFAVVRRRPVLEEYETRRRRVSDTVAGQWELAEWCRQNSLPKERQIHLQRVVDIDPEHVAARRGLGHIRQQGRWMSPNERMAAHGLVKHKGKPVLTQELELIEEADRISAAERSWLRPVKQWQAWMAGDRTERRTTAQARLNGLRDPHAVPALARTFRDDPRDESRLEYVAALSRIEGDRAIVYLAVQSIIDDSRAVREAAISAVRRRGVARAIPVYQNGLKNRLNLFVNRAGEALGQLGDDASIPNLIEALITRHSYRAILTDESPLAIGEELEDRSPIVFGPSAKLAIPGGRMPAVVADSEPLVDDPDGDEVEVLKDEKNPGVQSALTLLTGKNFGFDADAWRKWYQNRRNGGSSTKP